MSASPVQSSTRRPTWSEKDSFVPRRFVRPLQQFMDTETSGTIVMLVAAVAALAWANSPWYRAQETLWTTELTIELGQLAHLQLSLVDWVNDALMAVFFLLVGLEIKRELIHGELRDPRKAALPAIAALGGMIAPAAIFLLINRGGDGGNGWGIPMATDIAFAVAVVTLVGDKVPSAAKVFLLTLAIADDIGAIVVIGIFYTEKLSFGWLAIALATLVAAEVAKRLHVRALPVYLALGGIAWFGLHEAGVHATLAGVALGLMTPAFPFYDPDNFGRDIGSILGASGAITSIENLDDTADEEYDVGTERLSEIHRLVTETQSPLDRIASKLNPWVAFAILPLFAFSNAGVRLSGDALDGVFSNKVVVGIALGLLVGKTIGVFSFTVIGQKLGIGALPDSVGYRTVLGLSITAGVGFTVALFVAGLAFEPGSPHGADAKIGILAGSLLAGITGYLFLKLSPGPTAASEERNPSDTAPAVH